MKFSCGVTDEEWKKRVNEWHPHFLLFPSVIGVRKNGEKICAWLETVERRAEYAFVGSYTGHRYAMWEYRPLSQTAGESDER